MVNPKLILTGTKLVATKDGRKALYGLILGIIIILLLLFSFFAYMISAPFSWLKDIFGFSGSEIVNLQEVQSNYKNFIQLSTRVIDRGGYYLYPTEGTTGTRGFSLAPVPHPVLNVPRPHLGQDFNTAWRSDLMAIADGQVVDIGIGDETGMYITLIHNINGKKFFTRYLHLSRIFALQDAQIKQGDVIAAEGGQPNLNDGKPFDVFPGVSTGHHLHFEVREGSNWSDAVPVDPKLYIDPIPVSISSSSQSCTSSDSDGSIIVNISGGRDRGFEVSKDGGVTWTYTNEKQYKFSSLTAGTYSVIARDISYISNSSSISKVEVGARPKPSETTNTTGEAISSERIEK